MNSQSYFQSFLNNELNLRNLKNDFTLDRVKRLLKILGHPEKKLKIIHIAGSKGKGSTCAITCQILKEAGLRVGLYTSPHLNNYRERIRILDSTAKNPKSSDIFSDSISKQDLNNVIKKIDSQIRKVKDLTFFEVFTAIAFYYFAHQKVDLVVLETGLGGRLDATNAAQSIVAAICPISLEHADILGKTIAQIAAEKAAIIKSPHQKVVLAPQVNQAKQVILKQCQKYKIKPICVGSDISFKHRQNYLSGQVLDIESSRFSLKNVALRLLGQHQMINAATAVGIIECLINLGYDIQPQAIDDGCANVFWPGRFEVIQKDRVYIFDGAHNKASMQSLIESIPQILPQKKITVVLGVSSDKDREAICRSLNKISSQVIVTKANHPRAADFTKEDLKKYFPGKLAMITSDVQEALKQIKQKTKKNEIVLITGSLFVVAEARRYVSI